MMGYFGCENLIILTDSDYPSLTWGWNISGYYKMRLLANKINIIKILERSEQATDSWEIYLTIFAI